MNKGDDNINQTFTNLCNINVSDYNSMNRTEHIPSNEIQSNRNYKSYCTHPQIPEIFSLTKELLRNLVFYQKRAYLRNSKKAKMHRRYVVGLMETKGNLLRDDVRMIIMATDIQSNKLDLVYEIKQLASSKHIPIIYGMKRFANRHIMNNKQALSCVGIINYESLESTVDSLLQLANISK